MWLRHMVPLKLVTTWGDHGMRLGCVVRVESTEQDSMMSLARGMRPRHSL